MGRPGPGAFDCSGLALYAFSAAGISCRTRPLMQSRMGTPVSRADLRPGDLVFFYSPVSHVGIYIGNGQIVHAPTTVTSSRSPTSTTWACTPARDGSPDGTREVPRPPGAPRVWHRTSG